MKSKTHMISRTINASPEMLFKIVSEFSKYNTWNTIIPSANGELVEGEELQLSMRINDKTKPFNPKVISIEVNRSFSLSKVFLSKLIGELTHLFEFKSMGNNQTEFVQTWTGKGILVRMMWPKVQDGFSDFETFNNDLEKYVSKL